MVYDDVVETETGLTSGWTQGVESAVSGNETMREAFQVRSSTGTASCQITITSSIDNAGIVVAFMPNNTITSTGAVSMAGISVAGNITEANTASGAVSLANMSVSGTAKENVGASGGVSMSSMGVSGSAKEANTSSGGVSLASMSVSGTAKENVGASGGVAMAMSVAGSVTVSVPTFPQGPLDLDCDLYLGTAWVNVGSYVYQRAGTSPPIAITRGKPNESQTTDPSTCSWEWNNQDGRFSPLNPVSPYYGQLARNTLVRFSTQATTSYLRLENQDGSDEARAIGAAASALNITGDMEFRIQVQLTDWTPCMIAGRWDSGQSWSLVLENSGCVTLWWSNDGSTTHSLTSTAPLPFSRSQFAIRVTFAVASGTATFYTSPTIDGTYTQLGSAVAFGSTSLFAASGTPLEVGHSVNWVANAGHSTPSAPTPYGALHGRVYEARLYNGIGGTVVADGVFSAQVAGSTGWTDAHGIVWSMDGGGEISAREFRFHGQMSNQPPTWDKTSRDMAVNAQGSGLLRLIGQGAPAPVSALYRGVSLLTGSHVPIAYWPLEDASGASYFSAAIGPNPMTWGSGSPQLASSQAFPCSKPLPALNSSQFIGKVPVYTGGTTWSVRALVYPPTVPVNNQVFIQVNCYGGLAAYVVFVIDHDGTVAITATDASGGIIADSGAVTWPVPITQPMMWSIEVQPSGSNVRYNLYSLQPGVGFAYVVGVTSAATGSAGFIGSIIVSAFGGFTDTVIGHIFAQTTTNNIFDLSGPLSAWSGEPAAQRYARACKENGYSSRIVGVPAISAPMGYQGADTLPTILQECETADMGQMFESRDSLALGYRTLASMLNQAPVITIDYSQAMVGGVSEGEGSEVSATYDDLQTRNDWTLNRGGSAYQGGTYRYQLNDGSPMSVSPPPIGVGDYPSSKTINLSADSQLVNAAGWLVHLGTINEARWPTIPLNLARASVAGIAAAATFMDIGDVAAITNVPNVVLYDPVGQIVLGPDEDLGAFFWWMQFNGSPASVYNTGVYNNTTTAYDTAGSTLHTTATYPQSSLSVSTNTGPLWTTSAGDFPFDINISGMRLTVTNITGSSSPQTFAVTPAVNGVQKTLSAGTDVRLWTPPIYAPI
jgi:hypothetical protein